MPRAEAMPSPAEIALHLDKHRADGDGFMACCPAHDDTNPSLSISPGRNGGVVWRCFAGCSQESVQDALHARGLWPYQAGGNRPAVRPAITPPPAPSPTPRPIRRQHVSLYLYEDELGVPLSSVRRGLDHFEDGTTRKTFAQWRYAQGVPDPSPLPKGYRRDGDWVTGLGVLDGMRRVLFNLPGITGNPGRTVFVVEGEKDAQTLAGLGLLATTKPEGVVKTAEGRDGDRWRPVFTDTLRGRQVVILPDNDEPGHRHAEIVASWLHAVCPKLRIVTLPDLPPGGDVTDWVTAGGTRAQLEAIVTASPVHLATPDPELATATGDGAHITSASQPPEPPEPSAPFRLPGRHEVTGYRINDILASSVTPEQVRWWWPGWLPVGKVAVLDGDPGLGKSGITLDLAARITRGRPMPDGSRGDIAGPSTVLLCSHEDGLADTIVPRFLAMGGDASRLRCLDDVTEFVADDGQRRVPFMVPDHLDAFREHVISTGAALAIIDPWVAYLSSDKDSHRDQDVRSVLRVLADVAQETGCSIILVRHLNKAGGGSALYRGGGSIGIIGAVRVGWLTDADPDDETGKLRILTVSKSNLAEKPPSLRYLQQGMPDKSYRVDWLGESDHTATSLLNAQSSPGERSAGDEARQLLLNVLGLGPVPAEDVKRQARALDISEKVLRTAGMKLRITRTRKGFGPSSKLFWALPDTTIDAQSTIDAHRSPVSRGRHQWASMGSEGIYEAAVAVIHADLGVDDGPFRETPVAHGAQGAQAFHVHTGHETLSALGLDEHLGKPPASVPVAPQPARGVTFTGTGAITRCDIPECYAPATSSHHGQILCFRHHPMGTAAPPLSRIPEPGTPLRDSPGNV